MGRGKGLGTLLKHGVVVENARSRCGHESQLAVGELNDGAGIAGLHDIALEKRTIAMDFRAINTELLRGSDRPDGGRGPRQEEEASCNKASGRHSKHNG